MRRRGERPTARSRLMRGVVGVGVLLGALAGCRGCGCEGPESALDAAAVDLHVPDASLAQTMGPDAVERAITEGLRAVARRDSLTAIARFEAAASADPGRRVPHQRLCGLYRQDGRTADALRACRAWRELETEPDFAARADAIITELQEKAAPDEAGQGSGQP